MSFDDERRPGADESFAGWRRVDDPETARWVTGVEQATHRWGAAFLAYLLLPNTDPTSPTVEREFVDSYAGWYPNRQSLIRAQLENLGWTDALARFRTDQEIPPHALDFDWDTLWQHCIEVYDVVERLGGVHAFLR